MPKLRWVGHDVPPICEGHEKAQAYWGYQNFPFSRLCKLYAFNRLLKGNSGRKKNKA